MRILIVFVIFSFCVSCVESHMPQSTSSIWKHMNISNKIGDKYILSSNKDSICFDTVFYYKEHGDTFCILGNIDGKYSLFLVLDTKKKIIVFREEMAKVDSIKYLSLEEGEFMLVDRLYSDMCAEQVSFEVYLMDGGFVRKCYSDIKKETYVGAESYCSDSFNSYEKFYTISCKGNIMIIDIDKVYENEKTERTKESIDIGKSYKSEVLSR